MSARFEHFPALGPLVLQDQRVYTPDGASLLPPHLRAAILACRVIDRDRYGRFVAEGHEGDESGSPARSVGDVGLGSVLWPTTDETTRPIPAWFLAAPAVTAERSRDLRPLPVASGSTDAGLTSRLRAAGVQPVPGDPAAQRVRVRPVGEVDYRTDDRFALLDAALAPDLAPLPKGWPGIVLGVTQEGAQRELFFPAGGNALVAVNAAGDPAAASVVYDLTATDELDRTRSARLHSLVRVARLPGAGGLAWQLTQAGRDGIDGHGLFVDKGSVVAATDAPPPTGIPLPEDQGSPDGTRTRPPGGSTAPGSQAPPPGGPPNAGAQLVYAFASAKRSGPLEVGAAADKHRLGTTLDGEPINAGHVNMRAMFWYDAERDGPLLVDPATYTNPGPLPHRARVHLRWDPVPPHAWAGGVAPGVWRWEAEAPLQLVPVGDPPPNPPPPREPPPSQPRRPETGGFLPGSNVGEPGGSAGGGERDGVVPWGTGGSGRPENTRGGVNPGDPGWYTQFPGGAGRFPLAPPAGPRPPGGAPGGAPPVAYYLFDPVSHEQALALTPGLDAEGRDPAAAPRIGMGPLDTPRAVLSTPMHVSFGGPVSYRAAATSRGAVDAAHAPELATDPDTQRGMRCAPAVAQDVVVAANPSRDWCHWLYDARGGNGLLPTAQGSVVRLPPNVSAQQFLDGQYPTSPTLVRWDVLPPTLAGLAFSQVSPATGLPIAGFRLHGEADQSVNLRHYNSAGTATGGLAISSGGTLVARNGSGTNVWSQSGGVVTADEVSTPSTPASGYRSIYPKTDGWYDLDAAGTETKLGGGAGGAFGGDGSLGDVTISANTAVAAADIPRHYGNLTINSGVSLTTDASVGYAGPFVVFVQGDLTVNGALHVDGRAFHGYTGAGAATNGAAGAKAGGTASSSAATAPTDATRFGGSIAAGGGGGSGGTGPVASTGTSSSGNAGRGNHRGSSLLDSGAGGGAGGAGASRSGGGTGVAGNAGSAATDYNSTYKALQKPTLWKKVGVWDNGGGHGGCGTGGGGGVGGAGPTSAGGAAGAGAAQGTADVGHGAAGAAGNSAAGTNCAGGGGGGYGGLGGGVLYVEVNGDVTIGASGRISARGGNGGAGGAGGYADTGANACGGGGGGGGGGGAGGVVVIRYTGTLTNSGSIDANGGTGGAGGAAGGSWTGASHAAGAAGGDGEDGWVQYIKVTA